jgi:YegS/Rv2252/BmrU family lipid kinase
MAAAIQPVMSANSTGGICLSDFQDLSAAEGGLQPSEGAAPRRRHLFIINPRSFRFVGGTAAIIAEINSYFQRSGQENYQIHVSRYPRDAVGVIRKFAAAEEGVVRVYAVGGNGILFDCLNGIMGIDGAELATVPYGSTNDFVRSFGEDKPPLFRDIAKQVTAGTIKTDVLNCGSNYAINFCTVGVESASIMCALRFTRLLDWAIRLSRRIVPFIFILGGVASIGDKKLRRQKYSVTLDGQRLDGNYATINIANGPCYGGNKSAVTSALPNDGVLDVLSLKSTGFLQTLAILPRYLRGGYYKFPDLLTYRRAQRVEISSETPILVNLDGEVFFDMRLSVEVVPQAVNIVAVDGLKYERRPDAREPQ